MFSILPTQWPSGFHQLAQGTLDLDLSTVALYQVRGLKRLGLNGFAAANTVAVDASTCLTDSAGRFLLGHELAHIKQQQLGRTQAIPHCSLSKRDMLEAEADRVGSVFHSGYPDQKKMTLTPAPNSGPLFSVFIDDQEILEISDLSQTALSILTAIHGGTHWLQEAILHASKHTFLNEADFLCRTQFGLHGVSDILFSQYGFWIHPRALMQYQDLVDLLAEASPEEPNTRQITAKIADLGFLTTATVETNQSWLTDLGILNWPGFLFLNTASHVAIANTIDAIDETLEPVTLKTIAQFAVALAASAEEFAEFFRFGMTVAKKDKSDKLSDVMHNVRLSLQPMILNRLRCPLPSEPVTSENLQSILENYLSEGFAFPGFYRLSHALAMVAPHLDFENTSNLVDSFETYCQEAVQFVTQNKAEPGIVSQDGQRTTFHIATEDGTATLQFLSGTGIVLNAFTPGEKTEN